jgi:predicted RNA-binding Zn-ribbon protein involved in translation (DUF1610 family)
MTVAVGFGLRCTRCGTTIGTYASAGGTLACPNCGGAMAAAPANATITKANVRCKCGFSVGLLSVAGAGPVPCPQCGTPLQ